MRDYRITVRQYLRMQAINGFKNIKLTIQSSIFAYSNDDGTILDSPIRHGFQH